MATNIAAGTITQTSIAVRGYYSGSTVVYKCHFYCDNEEYDMQVVEAGSTSWTTEYRAKTGLLPSTSHQFFIIFCDANDSLIAITSVLTLSTSAPPPPPSPSFAPLVDTSYGDGGRFEGGIMLYWGSSSGATSYRVKARRGYDSALSYFDYSTTLGLVAPLDKGTTYFFSVRATNDNGSSSYTSENQATTAPQTPTINVTNVTGSSVTISLGTITGDWTFAEIYRYDSVGNLLETKTISKPTTSVVFSNLAGNTTYKFDARLFLTINSINIRSIGKSDQVTVTTLSNRPANWEWTSAELNLFNNGGAVSNISYTRWNAFISRVQEFVVYYNAKNNTSVPSVTSATMTASDRTLTATRFNLVRSSIGSMYPTGITVKSPGDIVDGGYFITLRDSLNNIT
jgi:hypothetical protein